MALFSFVCVDFQKEFTDPSGNFYMDRPMVRFTKSELIPALIKKKYKVAEIVADYRQPRCGDKTENCVPGTSGFESELPAILKNEVWVKAMNSPLWTRKNAGISKKTGWPYVDETGFAKWLKKNVRSRNCLIFGLTLDRCLFCVAQELSFRGYNVGIIREACDTYSGLKKEKELLFKTAPVSNWAKPVSWNTLKKKL
ncbi:MAG: isochorismatase family protein [Elusimicrobiota bacterium]|nr:isochorismatase family protein [Elusimicrobiota bacterium]